MKIFLDSANINDIKPWVERGVVDGITTNPSHLSKQTEDPKKIISELCALLPQGEISVQVTEQEPKAVYAQAKKIAALHPNCIVKIPGHLRYYSVIDALAAEEIPLNITLVFTLPQALMMAKLGVAYVSCFVARLDEAGGNGVELIESVACMLQDYDYETQLLVASIRDVNQLNAAIESGADALTLSPALLETALAHPLIDSGIATFSADWAKVSGQQFP